MMSDKVTQEGAAPWTIQHESWKNVEKSWIFSGHHGSPIGRNHQLFFDSLNPLVMTNIAIKNGPFIVDLSIKHGDFSWLC